MLLPNCRCHFTVTYSYTIYQQVDDRVSLGIYFFGIFLNMNSIQIYISPRHILHTKFHEYHWSCFRDSDFINKNWSFKRIRWIYRQIIIDIQINIYFGILYVLGPAKYYSLVKSFKENPNFHFISFIDEDTTDIILHRTKSLLTLTEI